MKSQPTRIKDRAASITEHNVTELVKATLFATADVARMEMFRPGGSDCVLERIGDAIYEFLAEGDVHNTVLIQICQRDPAYVRACLAEAPK